MINRIMLLVWFTAFATTSNGQTVLQGDSLYRGLQVGKSGLADVDSILGRNYVSRKRLGWLSGVNFSQNGIITTRHNYIYGYTLTYKKLDVKIRIKTAGKAAQLKPITDIEFGPNSNVGTSKGIQTSKNNFAEVISLYGPLDSIDSRISRVYIHQWVSTDRKNKLLKRNYTILHYPGISFVSYKKWEKSKGVHTYRVDEIWL